MAKQIAYYYQGIASQDVAIELFLLEEPVSGWYVEINIITAPNTLNNSYMTHVKKMELVVSDIIKLVLILNAM